MKRILVFLALSVSADLGFTAYVSHTHPQMMTAVSACLVSAAKVK